MNVPALRIFLCGMLVGAFDLVPGISGGTVAFILGIYDELIQSIARIRIRFLLPYVAGIACSFITLAKIIQYLLQSDIYRPFLFSSFLGLVVGSVIICARLFVLKKISSTIWLLVGAVAAYILSGPMTVHAATTSDLWVVACGMMAVSAMLLPGISGSYILNVFGMYGLVLGALVSFLDALQSGAFDAASFRILACMATGIALGALVFSRAVRYLLKTHPDETHACLLGFMIGALRSVWPFWDNAEPVLPDPTSNIFIIAFALFSIGLLSVISIEYMAKRKHAL